MLSKPADDRAFAHPRLLLALRASATPTTQTVVAFGEGGRRRRAPDSFSVTKPRGLPLVRLTPSIDSIETSASESIRGVGWVVGLSVAGGRVRSSHHQLGPLPTYPSPRLLAASSSIARPPHLHAHLHQTRTLTSIQSTEFTGCEDVHARGRGFQARPGGGAPFRQGKSRHGREIEVYRKGEGAWAMHACTHTYVHRLCVGVLEIGVWCG